MSAEAHSTSIDFLFPLRLRRYIRSTAAEEVASQPSPQTVSVG